VSPGYRAHEEWYIPNSGSKASWKPFQHYKCWMNAAGAGSFFVPIDTADTNYQMDTINVKGPVLPYTGHYGAVGKPIEWLLLFYDPMLVDGFVPPPADLDWLKQQSLNAMLPTIKGQLSAVNSLLELKDLISLKKRIEQLRLLWKNPVVTHILRYARLNPHLTAKQLLRSGAGDYLQWSFGLRPLISDVLGVYRAVRQTQKRVNAFVSSAGRTRTSHYTRVLEEYTPYQHDVGWAGSWSYVNFTDPNGQGIEGSWSIAAQCHTERDVWTNPTVFHAQVEYNYNYTQYQLDNARMLGLLDAIGVNLNPAIIWNAIPWSFVVDWVANVSSWLDQQKVGNMEPRINIHRYLWSVKRERRIQLTSRIKAKVNYITTNPSYPPQSASHPVVTETAYRRSIGIPDAASVRLSGLDSREFSLGAALVIVQGRRPRKPRH